MSNAKEHYPKAGSIAWARAAMEDVCDLPGVTMPEGPRIVLVKSLRIAYAVGFEDGQKGLDPIERSSRGV